jgi:hypothetical protein
MTIEEIDAALDTISKRSSFFTDEEVVKLFGEDWVKGNPAFNGIYRSSTILNAALDMRLELMEGDTDGSIQDEFDSLTGSDISVG